ncbi:MAG: hypothetical protein ABEJ42_00375, partial [Halobacteriaceae archaeon]
PLDEGGYVAVPAGRSLTYRQHHCGRNEWRARTDGHDLLLLPAAGDWVAGGADCPVVESPSLHCGIPVVTDTVTVPGSGALTWRYDVVVPDDGDACVVPGRYRFARAFTTAGGDASATLRFDLVVTA